MRRLAYVVAVVLVQVAFVLRSGGDWMKGGRFIAPVIIPALVLSLLGIVAAARVLSRASSPTGTAAALVGSLLGVVIVVSPFIAGAVPAWSSNGRIGDASLVESGGYAEYSAFWAQLPSLVSCVKPGGSVATTEVGNLGFARRDLHVLDLRGLTDEIIATQSPASSKHTWGVALDDWDVATSVVGHRILQVHPDEIVLLAPPRRPAQALGGAYRRVRVVPIAGDLPAVIYAPVATASRCGRT
jgi:hypothetical protein